MSTIANYVFGFGFVVGCFVGYQYCKWKFRRLIDEGLWNK